MADRIKNVQIRVALLLPVFLTLFLSVSMPCAAAGGNDKTAQELFNKAYNQVMGPQGSSFHYAVNIVGIYKTEGDIIYKEKKSYFEENRMASWDNGTIVYKADKKKQEVNIYRSDDENRDKYLSKFDYDINKFEYSYITKGDCYEITAKVPNAKFFGVREAKILVKKSNLHPVSLTVKVAFMHATIKITNFKSGNVSDSSFVFPKKRFAGYKTIDHRNE